MNYLRYLEREIHSVIAATVDDNGLPITCAIDIMDSDEKACKAVEIGMDGDFFPAYRRGEIFFSCDMTLTSQ